MYFELNGKTFGVKFFYQGTTTFAELVEVKDSGIVRLGICGFAALHVADKFEKKVGRKVALAHLLEYMSMEWKEEFAEEDPREFIITREDRKVIWEAYFKTHRK